MELSGIGNLLLSPFITKSSGCFSTLFKTRLLKAKEYLNKPFELKLNQESGTCEKVIASNSLKTNICDSWQELIRHNHAALIMNGDIEL